MKHVNPVHLVDRQVKVVVAPHLSNYPGCVRKIGSNRFEIIVYESKVAELAKSIGVSPSIITLGIMYHEIAHLRYDSFYGSNEEELQKWIDNIIEDSRVEYLMSFDFPYVAKYIGLMLAAAKKTVMEVKEQGENGITKKLTNALYDFVRFGIIDNSVDKEFIDFMCPRVILARRGNRQKSKQIVDEIYQYIRAASDLEHPGLSVDDNASSVEASVPEDESCSVGSDNDNKNSTADDGQNDSEDEETKEEEKQEQSEPTKGDSEEENVVEEQEPKQTVQDKIVKELVKQVEDIEAQIGIGKSDDMISEVVKDNDYFRTVVSRNRNAVKKLNKVFKSIFTKMVNVPTKEGDINIQKIQNAYLSNMIGEESNDYFVQKRVDPHFDCVIIRDISGSTDYVKDKYAKSVCVIMKALDEIAGARVSLVDFHSSPQVTKRFKDSITQARIIPRAHGGTDLYRACHAATKLDFKNKVKIAIVITDGHCSGAEEIAKMASESDINWLPIYFGSNSYHWAAKTISEAFGDVEVIESIEDLHKGVLNLINRRLRIW